MENSQDLLIITGSYGSGKTEYAVNLAVEKNQGGAPTTLVDLDVVNPYFRSRDVRDQFSSLGIEVVAPEGAYTHADLPMLSPRVKGAVKRTDRAVILDVGGDPMGARVLGRFSQDIMARAYSMTLIVNTRRPETEDLEKVLNMAAMIQRASGLQITELVANSHLMEFTDTEVVVEGIDVTREAARTLNAKFTRVCVLEDHLDNVDASALDAELVVLKKFMKKPWEPGCHKAYRC
ncbi:hypothetical protein [Desulfatibacillum aliphaticivorans]|uniref:hypothetical protein n=1 Tax=Desulfatibacillum aliphaticivorans TaxID=218208 RepID=UPI00040647C7|nr:hypothetical protein [Desulfatibacillum aliphaticivorans]